MRPTFLLILATAAGLLGSAPAWADQQEAPAAGQPPAPKSPDATDGVMIWPWWRVGPDAPAGTPQARADMAVYYIKQFWLTPNSGIYTFYNTGQAAVLRYQHRWQLPGEFSVTGMAGMRAIIMGDNPPTPSVNFRTGPEVALSVSRPLFGKVSGQLFGTYAPLFPLNADAIPASSIKDPVHCVFYGANLITPIGERTTMSLGVQGQVNSFFTAGLQFHNLGPTLTFTHAF